MTSIDLSRLFFCRIEWMKRYQGLSDDPLEHFSSRYAREHGYGMECWNYLAYRGTLYGFVHHSATAIVNRLTRNCGEDEGQDTFTGTTVVWVATRDRLATETYVIGWWKDATVYREFRPHPRSTKIKQDILKHGHNLDEEPTFCISCSETDSYLVPEPERVFQIPRRSGWMGDMSLVWYADGRDEDNKNGHCLLKKNVNAYITGISSSGTINWFPEFDDSSFEEGKRKLMSHFARERSRAAVRNAKRAFQNRHGGRLFCQACKFDFSETYGDVGESFIEAHHLRPLAGEGSRKTTSKDFVMLCSNCHRMVHRLISKLGRPVKQEEIEELVIPGFANALLLSG